MMIVEAMEYNTELKSLKISLPVDDYIGGSKKIYSLGLAEDCQSKMDNFIVQTLNNETNEYLLSFNMDYLPTIDETIMVSINDEEPAVLNSDYRYSRILEYGDNEINVVVYSTKITKSCRFDLSMYHIEPATLYSMAKSLDSGSYFVSYNKHLIFDDTNIDSIVFSWELNGVQLSSSTFESGVNDTYIRLNGVTGENTISVTMSNGLAELSSKYQFNIESIKMGIEVTSYENGGEIKYGLLPYHDDRNDDISFSFFKNNNKAIFSDGVTSDSSDKYQIVAFLDSQDENIDTFNREDFISYYQYVEVSITEVSMPIVRGFNDTDLNSLIRPDLTVYEFEKVKALPFDGDMVYEPFLKYISEDKSMSMLTYENKSHSSKLESNKIYKDVDGLGLFISDSDENFKFVENGNLGNKLKSDVDLEETFAAIEPEDFELKEILFGSTYFMNYTDGWLSGSSSLEKTYTLGTNLTQVQFTVYAFHKDGPAGKGVMFRIFNTDNIEVANAGIMKISLSGRIFRVYKNGGYSSHYNLVTSTTIVIPLEGVMNIDRMTMEMDTGVDDIRIKNIIVTTRK